MPNNITNELQFVGTKEAVQGVLNSIKGKYEDGSEMQIDFNKIIEMPKDLGITSDWWLSPMDNQFSYQTPLKQHLDEMRTSFEKNQGGKESTIEHFIQGVRNYLNYGHATWYTWNVSNWGTKWNAYYQGDKRNTSDTIYFKTAWSSPIKLIQKLSSQFPDVTLKLKYADEDSGSNTGILTFCKGEITECNQPQSQSEEGYNIYFDLHPDDKENYEFVDGEYRYKETDED